jgi:hypothetical protein
MRVTGLAIGLEFEERAYSGALADREGLDMLERCL